MSVLLSLDKVRAIRDPVHRLFAATTLLEYLLKANCAAPSPEASLMVYVTTYAELFRSREATVDAVRKRNLCFHEPTNISRAEADTASRVIIDAIRDVQKSFPKNWTAQIAVVLAILAGLGFYLVRETSKPSARPAARDTAGRPRETISPDTIPREAVTPTTLSPATVTSTTVRPDTIVPNVEPASEAAAVAYYDRLDMVRLGWLRTNYSRVALRNKCDEPLRVALFYRDLESNWVTAGWYTVDPDSAFATVARTSDIEEDLAAVYFYAETVSGKPWGVARSDEEAPRRRVSRNEHFVFRDDDRSTGAGRLVPFIRTRTLVPQFNEELREKELPIFFCHD